jgi:hypothetical protein
MTIGQLAAIRARIAGRLEPHLDVTEIAMAVADLRMLLDEVDRLHIERDSAYRRGVEQAIRSVEGEATPSALRQAERLRSILLDEGACRDLALEIKCKQAFRRGVEAMRAAAAQACEVSPIHGQKTTTARRYADAIRALPIPEDKS